MKYLAFIFFFILSQPAYSINTVATGYQLPTGGAPVTINAHGVCRIVRNFRAEPVFVPTKLAAEWSSFRLNPLPSITFENCCFGYKYAGYCYHLGGAGQTCIQACSGRGGCVEAGVTYVGSSGSAALCRAVLEGVGAPIMGDIVNEGTYDAPFSSMGCATVNYPGYQYVRIRMLGATTTCASGSDTYERICSCAQ